MSEKLDQILKEIGEVRTVQAVTNVRLDYYNCSLTQHMDRTKLAEERLKLLETDRQRLAGWLAGGLAVIGLLTPVLTYAVQAFLKVK